MRIPAVVRRLAEVSSRQGGHTADVGIAAGQGSWFAAVQEETQPSDQFGLCREQSPSL